MKSICAWCGADIKACESTKADDLASHGICKACSQAFSSQDGVSIQAYIDSIQVPILVVDSNTGVVGANLKACEVLGRRPEKLLAQLIGPVFDCPHAHAPQECGRRIHCSGCSIRRCVLSTFSTGEPQISVPATLTSESPDRPSSIVLTITTVKAAGVVVLRIEELSRNHSASLAWCPTPH